MSASAAQVVLSLGEVRTYEGEVGPMHVTRTTWSKAVGDEFEARSYDRGWLKAQPAEEVEATSDGKGADSYGWCRCPERSFEVFYERWTAEGRVAHGWLCSKCRRYVQVG